MDAVIELPYGLPGRIYRGRMPFSPKDPEGVVFHRFKELGVSVVVLLAERSECLAHAGRDLVKFYADNGMDVIHLPTPDFSAPDLVSLGRALDETLEKAWSGRSVAVHCYAGYGRTGMFLACLARRVFQMNAEAAILWVRQFIPGAIEAAEQIEMVKNCE